MQIQCCNNIFLSQNDAPQIVLLNHVVLKTCSFEQQINFSGWTTGKSYLCMYVCICLCLVVIYFRHLGEAKVLIGVWLHRTNKKDFLHFVWLCLDATVLTQLLQYEQRKFKTQVYAKILVGLEIKMQETSTVGFYCNRLCQWNILWLRYDNICISISKVI